MIKKILLSAFFLFFVLPVSVYLLLPPPPALPSLPDSIQSIEPGDTIQLKGATALYTDNTNRQEILNFYQDAYSYSSLKNLPLFSYRLNHPPEKAREVFVETKQSYYLEEVIHPFRESLFINGFEWDQDPFTPPEKRIKNRPEVEGKPWANKISLMRLDNPALVRLTLFWAAFYLLLLTLKAYFETTKSFFLKIKKK